jgi:hypothetical protein
MPPNIPLAAAIVAVTVGAALTACTSSSSESYAEITSVTFSQSQAVQNFDDAEYTQSDKAEIAKIYALFDEFHISPATYKSPDTGGCAGGVTTDLSLNYSTTSRIDMTIDGCGAASGTFEGKATELFSTWHTELQE